MQAEMEEQWAEKLKSHCSLTGSQLPSDTQANITPREHRAQDSSLPFTEVSFTECLLCVCHHRSHSEHTQESSEGEEGNEHIPTYVEYLLSTAACAVCFSEQELIKILRVALPDITR